MESLLKPGYRKSFSEIDTVVGNEDMKVMYVNEIKTSVDEKEELKSVLINENKVYSVFKA